MHYLARSRLHFKSLLYHYYYNSLYLASFHYTDAMHGQGTCVCVVVFLFFKQSWIIKEYKLP